VLVNAAEEESAGDFHVPAVARDGVVEIAVSTRGTSPAAAAWLRAEIDAWLAANEVRIAEALARPRSGAGAPPPGAAARPAAPGMVYLVGAGPGDPGLLTLRAAEVLAQADVVYHDRLVGEGVLARIPARAETVYVGKEVGCAVRADIEDLLVKAARAGKRAVRLKGGDPLVFGRGAEEIMALRRAGVPFEVVPGVSALSSVPAAAGIPVTCRGLASEIVVRSGHHLEPGSGESAGGGWEDEALSPAPAALPAAPAAQRTYIYFMAARRLAEVVEDLRREGLPPATPVAVIQKGTLPEQKVLTSDLENLLAAAAREPIETPALVIAGEVVRFSELDQYLPMLERHAVGERR
jgi:uroporphyrin-III C-methyltransferase